LNQEYDEEKGRDLLGDEICNKSQIKDLIVVESMKDPLLEKKQYTGSMHTVALI
jgi:cationic amino acid transporter 1